MAKGHGMLKVVYVNRKDGKKKQGNIKIMTQTQKSSC